MGWDQKHLEKLLASGKIRGFDAGKRPPPKAGVPTRKNKYNNDGTGTSKLERKHQAEYELRMKAGEFREYTPQKVFVLQEGFRRDGKWIRKITYRADHYIVHLDGSEEVVDSKGVETEVFRIKRKLFLKKYPHIKFTTRK